MSTSVTDQGTSPSLRVLRLAVLLAGLSCASLVSAPTLDAQASPEAGQEVVLVTGSTSGLGREVARRLGAMGYFVIVHGRNRERGMAVVEAIESEGIGNARFYAADLSSFAQVRDFGETILRDYDRVDVLVNNAGFGRAPD